MSDDPNIQPDVDPDPLWSTDMPPEDEFEDLPPQAQTQKQDGQDDDDDAGDENASQDPKKGDEAKADADTDDFEITLPDGTKTPLADLELTLQDGSTMTIGEIDDAVMLRQTYDAQMANVVEQQTEMAQIRQAYEQEAQRMATAEQQLMQWIQALVPDPPDTALITQDPNAYAYQVQLREDSLRQANEMLEAIQGQAQQRGQVNEQAMQAHRNREDAAILREWPEMADPQTRAQYAQGYNSLMRDFGFTPEEISSTYDHRVMKLAWWAAEGMRAAQERNKQTAAQKSVRARAAKPTARRSVDTNAAAAAIARAKRPGATEDDAVRALMLAGG